MKYEYDLLVVGGGAAGLTAAAGAARFGLKVLLAEREPVLGGDCLRFGCVPSKTLIRTAAVRKLMGRAGDFGLPPVKLPPVDFRAVAGRIRSVIQAIQAHDSPERFCSLGAEVAFGAARFLDEHSLEVGGRRVSARFALIATGSSPALPDIPGLARTPHLTNRDLFDLPRLPASLCVLGGGAVAAEMAQAFARLGSRVTLIQRGPEILSREDPALAALVRAGLEADGVAVHTGTRVLRVRDLGDEREVVVERDGAERGLKAEALLVALGRTANVEGLHLAAAGIEADGRGVPTDDRLRTAHKHIFAAGDVLGRHQFTHAAGYEAGVVLANAVFRLRRKADYRLMPRCVFTDPELACVGPTEREAAEAGLRFDVFEESFADNDRARTEGSAEGRIKLLVGRNGRPLAAHLVGPRAGDLLSEWMVALAGSVPVSTLAAAVRPYPTLAEIGKRAAGQAVADKLFSPRVRATLHLLFGYAGRACGM